MEPLLGTAMAYKNTLYMADNNVGMEKKKKKEKKERKKLSLQYSLYQRVILILKASEKTVYVAPFWKDKLLLIRKTE